MARILARALSVALGLAILPLAPGHAQTTDPKAPVRLTPPQRLTPTPAPAEAPSAGPALVNPNPPSNPSPPINPNAVKVDPLAPIEVDWRGILEARQGALPPAFWLGTPRAFVTEMLPRLPITTSPMMQDMERRLLLSDAVPPEGRDEAGEPGLFARRIDALIARGLVEQTEAVLKISGSRRDDEAVDRVRVELRFLANDNAGACAAVNDLIKRRQGAWWDRALVACQALNKEHAKASLGLGLLREQKAPKDDVFDALVEAAAGRAPKMPPITDPSPLHLALMAAAKIALPPAAIPTAKPIVLAAWAGAENIPPVQRLPAAERATALGAWPPEKLRTLYEQVEFTPEERNNALARGAADKDGRGRALLYVAAKAQTAPAARAELIQAYLKLGRAAGDFVTAARIVEPLVAELRPSADLGLFTADAARVFLAVRRPVDAAAWWNAAPPEAISSLFIVARLAQGKAGPAWDAKFVHDGVTEIAKRDGEAGLRRAVLALGLLTAFDEQIGPPDWLVVIGKPLPAAGTMPPAALWLAAERAAASRRLGETLLLGLPVMADGDKLTQQAAVLGRAITGLRMVGLEGEARQIAVEAALAAGL